MHKRQANGIGQAVRRTPEALLPDVSVEARIRERGVVNVLDFGCGNMEYSKQYTKFFAKISSAQGKNVNIIAVDCDASACEITFDNFSNVGDVARMPLIFRLARENDASVLKKATGMGIDSFDFITIFNPRAPTLALKDAPFDKADAVNNEYVLDQIGGSIRNLLCDNGKLVIADNAGAIPWRRIINRLIEAKYGRVEVKNGGEGMYKHSLVANKI